MPCLSSLFCLWNPLDNRDGCICTMLTSPWSRRCVISTHTPANSKQHESEYERKDGEFRRKKANSNRSRVDSR
jgi:hypothetical protein